MTICNDSGSSIQVFGTNLSPGDNDTTVTFSIDGNVLATPTIYASQAPYQNQQFFSSQPLPSNTAHRLTMEISGSFSLTHPSDVVLDFLIYEATANSTIPSSETASQTSWIFVDDTSPYLEYSRDSWQPNPASYIELLHNSSIVNASVTQPLSQNSTVSLNFTGMSTVNYGLMNDQRSLHRSQVYQGSSHRVTSVLHQALKDSDGSLSTMA